MRDVYWNFSQLKLGLMHDGKRVILRGLQTTSVHMVSKKKFQKLFQKPSQVTIRCMGAVILASTESSKASGSPIVAGSQHTEGFVVLLQEFHKWFEEPQQLPSQGDSD